MYAVAQSRVGMAVKQSIECAHGEGQLPLYPHCIRACLVSQTLTLEEIEQHACQRRYKKGPATGLKVGQSIQTKSLSLRLGLIGVGEAAVA
jgi:hypothetical protein